MDSGKVKPSLGLLAPYSEWSYLLEGYITSFPDISMLQKCTRACCCLRATSTLELYHIPKRIKVGLFSIAHNFTQSKDKARFEANQNLEYFHNWV